MVRVRGSSAPETRVTLAEILRAGIGGIDDIGIVARMDEGRILLLNKGVDAQLAIVRHRHHRLRAGLAVHGILNQGARIGKRAVILPSNGAVNRS